MSDQINSDKEKLATTAVGIGATHLLVATRLKKAKAPQEMIDSLVAADKEYQKAVKRFISTQDDAPDFQQIADEMDWALAKCKVPFNSAIAWMNAHRKDASDATK
jgi:phosphate uptake regulator